MRMNEKGCDFGMSNILIVDDDPHIRELVRVFLQNEGFAIVEAADGLEALAALETLKAELVIVDVMMPNMDGWELCRELCASYTMCRCSCSRPKARPRKKSRAFS